MDGKMVVGAMREQRVASGQWLVVCDEGPGVRDQGLAAGLENAVARNPFAGMQNRQAKIQNRRGFTLTELLVVITIIAVLAALVSVGVMRALDSAKQTRIKVEVDNLDAAFKSYKEKYGSYPPTAMFNPMTNQALRAHIARAFPRYNLANLASDLNQVGLDLTNTRPDQALVFWLRGFGPDPTAPFVSQDGYQISGGVKSGTKVTVTPFFDFDKTRLVSLNTAGGAIAPSYIPPGAKANVPYLYFESSIFGNSYAPPYAWDPANAFDPEKGTNLHSVGLAPAYIRDVNGNGILDVGIDEWVNIDSFQILAPGLDGRYNSNDSPQEDPNVAAKQHLYPTGKGYSPFGWEDDNVTNFCEKARLGDAKP
jgi:prepilin-type N-terminal cleavage/methylation domain-containing protein